MASSQIIARLGGPSALAGGLGLPANDVGAKRVRAWVMRDRIPGEYWASIVAYSDRAGLGVTLADLASAHDTVGAL